MRLHHCLPLLALGLIAAAPSPHIIDGDTFTLGTERVRLWGIDAPEGRQLCQDAAGHSFRCGDVARERLTALIGGRSVDCRQKDRDSYGRMVAQCTVAGRDLGEAMVRTGWAVEYRRFSQGAYAASERTPAPPSAASGLERSNRPTIGGPTPLRSDRLRCPHQGPAC